MACFIVGSDAGIVRLFLAAPRWFQWDWGPFDTKHTTVCLESCPEVVAPYNLFLIHLTGPYALFVQRDEWHQAKEETRVFPRLDQNIESK